jgi:cobalt-precorrin 5A hydrolase/precorrin-3B C17-methyltransferase
MCCLTTLANICASCSQRTSDRRHLSGILIRTLAPLLNDKRVEPPVIAVAEDGSAVVPLLGGHHGGNALARRIADALGISAAVTTAGDVVHGVALDDPPAGWRVGNPEAAKNVMAAVLADEAVELVVDAPRTIARG